MNVTRKACKYSIPLFAAVLLAAGVAQGRAADAAALAQEPAGPFAQLPLPFAAGALAPYISEETVQYHYGKHYKANVDAINKFMADNPGVSMSLEKIIMSAAPGAIFNNAAQTWNHAFYFGSLKPNGGGKPSGKLAEAIERDFGSFAAFRESFLQAGQTLFGSGWVWLVLDAGKLRIEATSNADLPMKRGQKALFVLDIWEHAYYIDYRNARPKYLEAAFDHLLNWKFAAANYAAASKPQ